MESTTFISLSHEWWLVIGTFLLVFVTTALAIYTARLWRATKEGAERQQKEMQQVLTIARTSADAATRQANAAISAAAPMLYPRVDERQDLYPREVDADDMTHQSSALLRFENIGRSPAIVRKIGAKFFLLHREEFLEAPPPLASLPTLESSAIIGPGDTGGGKTWTFERSIDANEIRQLLATATAPHWLRFFIIGYVVYDDVFRVRHTQRFCVKVRRKFQAIKGSMAFNEITHQAAVDEVPEVEGTSE